MLRSRETFAGAKPGADSGTGFGRALWLGLPALVLVSLGLAFSNTDSPTPSAPAPTTPREEFNAGTAKLQAGKWQDAEALLQASIAEQNVALQPSALYNLAHARFADGAEALAKAKQGGPTRAAGDAAAKSADDALAAANAALESNDVQKMVAAYLRGRGVKKELRAATAAVQDALQEHGAVLGKWQRSWGDFVSSAELNNNDEDARHNADVVDRHVAKLVDEIRKMQQCMGGMCKKAGDLGEKLKQLKGKIPDGQLPGKGKGEDDEEDEDQPNGPKPGQKEGQGKDGREMALSREQAGWLLEGFKLDKERKLPMGEGPAGKPKDPNRPTW